MRSCTTTTTDDAEPGGGGEKKRERERDRETPYIQDQCENLTRCLHFYMGVVVIKMKIKTLFLQLYHQQLTKKNGYLYILHPIIKYSIIK